MRQPAWTRVLYDLPEHIRYVLIRGGRGSGKSWAMAAFLLLEGARRRHRIVIAREFMRTLADSSFSLLRDLAESHPMLNAFYDFKPSGKIIAANGTEFLFRGLSQATAGSRSVRSIEGITMTHVDEAQAVTQESWREMIPSVMRTEGCRLFATFNPTLPSDPAYKMAMSGRDDVLSLLVNWDKNPWFPKALNDERKWLMKVDPELAMHEWEGQLNAAAETAKKVLSRSLVEACFDAYKEEYEEGDLYAGYDIADEGFDYNAYVERRGPVVTHLERWSGVGGSLGESAERVYNTVMEHQVEHLSYDATGLGAGTKSDFKRLFGDRSPRVSPVVFNTGVAWPDVHYLHGQPQRDTFTNRFSQMCWAVRLRASNTQRLLKGEDIPPSECLFFHPRLREAAGFFDQLSVPVYTIDTRQIKVDKYGETEKETKRSPDMFDAVMLAFARDSMYGVKPPLAHLKDKVTTDDTRQAVGLSTAA